jgi:hypothetical protein
MQNEREAVERVRRALRTRPITLIIPQVYNEDRAGNNPWGAFADDLQTLLASLAEKDAMIEALSTPTGRVTREAMVTAVGEAVEYLDWAGAERAVDAILAMISAAPALEGEGDSRSQPCGAREPISRAAPEAGGSGAERSASDIRICAEEIVECAGLSEEHLVRESPNLLTARLSSVATLAKDILMTLDGRNG